MNFKLSSLLTAAVLSLGLITTSAQATSISAYTAEPSSDSDLVFADTNVGFRFTTSQDIFVTSLGVFDSTVIEDRAFQNTSTGLGLINAHDVGIWTDSGTLLSSTTVASGTTAELIDGFRYSDITTLKLIANEIYFVAATFLNDDAYLSEPSIIPATGITLLSSMSAAANFQFDLTDPSVVPVPAAAWLFGSALLGFFGFSRRKANA